eukprot:7464194-Heterocapsa_arctica.AAC.1
MNHRHFPYYEGQHLQFIKHALTVDWPELQGGCSIEALKKWHLIFEWLELDRKAVLDMMLLAHSGL